MNTLAIISHLERLPDGYEAGFTYFGLTVTPAAVGPGADVNADLGFLQPWLWNPAGITVWVQPDGHPDQGKFLDAAAVRVMPDLTGVTTGPVVDSLLDNKPTSAGAVSYNPANPTVAGELADGAMGTSWHSILAHAALYPAPIPHALNLVHVFKVPTASLKINATADNQVLMWAALSLKKNPFTADAPPAAPAAGMSPLQAVPKAPAGVMSWAHTTQAGDPKVTTLVNGIRPFVPETPTADALIDLNTLWIKALPVSKDWRAALPQLYADAFDFGQRMTGLLSDAKTQDGDFDLAGFQSSTLGMMRNTANSGLGPAPDGSSLAQVILGLAKAGQIPVLLNALQAWEAATNNAAWLKTIGPALSGQATQGLDQAPADRNSLARQLQALQSAISDDRALAGVLLAQWDTGFQANAAANAVWQTIRLQVSQTILPSLQIRKRMLLGNIGGARWTALTAVPARTDPKDPPELDRLGASFATGLLDYVNANQPPADHNGRIAPYLNDFAAKYFQQFVRQPATAVQTERVPQPVVFQVDSIADVPDADDYHRRIAGCSVLLRVQGGPWRCLTRAAIAAVRKDGNGNPAAMPVVPNSTAIPYRLDYHNQLRQALVSYNNHPLVAQSLAAGLAGTAAMTPSADSTNYQANLLYTTPLDGTGAVKDPWATMPGLCFGRKYEFLSCVITNTGALPAELAADAPGNGKFPMTMKAQAGFDSSKVDPKYIASITYLRRVPVGPVRFAAKDNAPLDGTLQVPAVADGVFPLARDVEDAVTVDNASSANRPLIFLNRSDDDKSNDSFTFYVRPPATDLNTWDRTVGADPANKDLRKQIWAAFHRLGQNKADDGNPANKPQNTGDVTVDDPAVGGYQFILSPVCVESGAAISPPAVALLPRTGAGLNVVQTSAIPVTCSAAVGLNPQAGLVVSSSSVQVTIPPGEVWELSIQPAWNDATTTPKLFDTGIVGNLPALKMVVECAGSKAVLPSAEQVWKMMQASFDANKRAISVSFAQDVLPADGSTTLKGPWKYVSSVDVLRQTWRWDGRPLDRFAFFGVPSDQLDAGAPDPGSSFWKDSAAMVWEGGAFGARSDSSRREATTRVNFARFATSDAMRAQTLGLFTEDFSSDARAHYFRFGVRIRSRYDGTESATALSRVGLKGPTTAGTIWKRTIVPPGLSSVPKPKLKLVLPLTVPLQADGAPPSVSPGLLCVLDEPWFEHAGLAEAFAATRTEYGPDPILETVQLDEPNPKIQPLQVYGPLGFTFDTNTDAPLFANASFIVSPPDPKADAAWYFGKVTFRRELVFPVDAAGNPVVKSPETDPQWVQFLPDFTTFGGVRVPDQLRLKRTGATTLQVVMPGGGPFTPAAPFPRPGFEIRVVVTRKVTDVLGRENQEQYVNSFLYGESGLSLLDAPPDQLGLTGVLRGRLLEVQMAPGAAAPDPKNPWSDLFPDDATADAIRRIVRVSPPFEMDLD